MKRVDLSVETLRCEADESTVLDELLAREGVVAAEIDLARELVTLAYDEARVTRGELVDRLRFFGLSVRRTPVVSR